MGLGVNHVHRDLVAGVEQLERAHHPLGGQLHLRAPVGHPRAHRAARVHHDRHRHRRLALLLAHLERHRQHVLQRRAPIAALAEAVPSARHHQPAAGLADVLGKHLEAALRQPPGLDVLQHHHVDPIQELHRHRRRWPHLEGHRGSAQRPLERARGLVRDEEHPGRALHPDDRPADVVLADPVTRGRHPDLVGRQPRCLHHVAEGERRRPPREVPRRPGQRCLTTRQQHRRVRLGRRPHRRGQQKRLSHRHPRRNGQARHRHVERPVVAATHEAHVDGNTASHEAPRRCPSVETGRPPVGQHQHPAGAFGRNQRLRGVEGTRQIRRLRVDHGSEAPEALLGREGHVDANIATEGEDSESVTRTAALLHEPHELFGARLAPRRHRPRAIHHHHHVAARAAQRELGTGQGEEQQQDDDGPEPRRRPRHARLEPPEEAEGDEQQQHLGSLERHGRAVPRLRAVSP